MYHKKEGFRVYCDSVNSSICLMVNEVGQTMEYTVLCWTSAHGRSQLKRQNWRVCAYTENMLKWFNYPHVRAHPRCEVSCHGTESTCIVGSSIICRGQPNNGENCIVLQSGPTRSLVAKFLQRSVVACNMRISCCRRRTL